VSAASLLLGPFCEVNVLQVALFRRGTSPHGRPFIKCNMRLVMLDRDGVINVPRKYHVKSPADMELIPGAGEAIAKLSRAGVRVAICTNQPEVSQGIINRRQLDAIHESLRRKLGRMGARIDLILCCIDDCRSAARKPAPGMLLDAMRKFGAKPADTPFVGDQLDDLRAAASARCQRVLVRSGNGLDTERQGIPNTLRPFEVHEDLAAFAGRYLRNKKLRRLPPSRRREPPRLFISRAIRDYRRSRSQPRREASE
jgi:D-glycero-D-manno-heptose 1,7-bisphosphate phosphatase